MLQVGALKLNSFIAIVFPQNPRLEKPCHDHGVLSRMHRKTFAARQGWRSTLCLVVFDEKAANVRRTGRRAPGKWIPPVLLGRVCLCGTHAGMRRVTYRNRDAQRRNRNPMSRRSSRVRESAVGVCREESSRENAKRGAGRRQTYLLIRGGFQCPVRLSACFSKPRRTPRGDAFAAYRFRSSSLHPALRH
jgi:hypothetical protein